MRTELETAKLDELNLLERLARTRQRIRRLALQPNMPVVGSLIHIAIAPDPHPVLQQVHIR